MKHFHLLLSLALGLAACVPLPLATETSRPPTATAWPPLATVAPTVTATPLPVSTAPPLPTATRLAPTATPHATRTPTTVRPSTTPSPWPTLARTLRLQNPALQGDDVWQVQQRLLELGYVAVGVADGVFGAQTDAGVRHFQLMNQLAVDGVVGPMTYARLLGPAALPDHLVPPYYEPDFTAPNPLYPGDSLLFLQGELFALGYVTDPNAWQVGEFDAVTRAALQQFQAVNGLPATGEISWATWNALFSDFALRAEAAPGAAVAPWPARIFKIANRVDEIAWDGTRLWVLDSAERTLTAIDPQTGPTAPFLLARDDHPTPPGQIVFAAGQVWVRLHEEGYVLGFDPQTSRRVAEYELPRCEECFFPMPLLAFDGANLWVAPGDDTVQALDVTTGKSVAAANVGFLPHEALWANACLWVLLDDGGLIRSTGPSGSCSAEVMAYGPMAFANGQLWVASGNDVNPHDPISGEVREPGFMLSGYASGLVFDGQRLWLTVPDEQALYAYDLATQTLSAPIPVFGHPMRLVWDGTRLWMAHVEEGVVEYWEP